MFEVICTDCGQATTVPFKPTVGKLVYCRTCFSNTCLSDQKMRVRTPVLMRNRHGHDEETTGEEEKSKSPPTFSISPSIFARADDSEPQSDRSIYFLTFSGRLYVKGDDSSVKPLKVSVLYS